MQLLNQRYRIDNEIAKTTHSVIYAAQDEITCAQVVVKMSLHAHTNNLFDEYSLLKEINDAHVVKVIAFDTYENKSFYVMAPLDGLDLKQWMQSGNRCNFTESIYVIYQLFTTLHLLHQVGIIHADIKPSNIMIDPKNHRITLIDFGVARRITDNKYDTKIAGSTTYMSPEQANGQALSFQSDLYAAGLIWFELLTGEQITGLHKIPDDVIHYLQHKKLNIKGIKRAILTKILMMIKSLLTQNPRHRTANANIILNMLKKDMLVDKSRHTNQLKIRHISRRLTYGLIFLASSMGQTSMHTINNVSFVEPRSSFLLCDMSLNNMQLFHANCKINL